MSAAYAIAAIILAVIGFLVWFSHSQRRSAILAFREAEIRQIAKIHSMGKKIDEETETRLDAVRDPNTDPRVIWLHNQKRVPHVPGSRAPGNTDPK